MPDAPDRVFLDACVLYPMLVRRVLIAAARADLFTPVWSARVLDEWRLAAARRGGPEGEAGAVAEAAELDITFPSARAEPDDAILAAIRLPDPSDVHVLAAAVAAQARLLVTFNLRDFPVRRLSLHGVAPRHPDGFLWELLSTRPAEMTSVLTRSLAPLGLDGRRAERNALRRAGLSRLGKAWESTPDQAAHTATKASR